MNTTVDITDFYLVWNPNGLNPGHRHSDRSSATTEAERLADREPSQVFYVLHAVSVSKRLRPVQTTELQPGPTDDLPF